MTPDHAAARIVCVCVYYAESPSWLGQHMASLAPVVSDFVYVDGGYALYPGALRRPASQVECALELHEMARSVGRSLLHFRPSRPFDGNEVEKRNLSVALARALPGVDGDAWILVADADLVAVCADPRLPELLASTDLAVAEYAWESTRRDWQAEVDRGNRWALLGMAEDDAPQRVRGLYRNLPGLAYGPAHWHVSADGDADGGRRWLWHRADRQESALDASGELVFEHRRSRRIAARNDAAAEYYTRRDELGIER